MFGLRNPWRFSFDDRAGGSGMMFCADVGQGKFEEVNIIDPGPGGDAGGNYGWRIKEGTSLFDKSSLAVPENLIDPVAEYAHPEQGGGALLEVGRSIIGGCVYRGTKYPELSGIYVFADWSTEFSMPNGTLLGMEDAGGGNWNIAAFEVEGGNPIGYFISAIGEDEDGEVYVAAKTVLAASGLDPVTATPTGTIFRIHTVAPAVTKVLPATRDNSIFEEFEGRSSGAGNSLFSGTTDDGNTNLYERRALLAFDIGGNVPSGAQVTSASLNLRVTNVPIPPAGPGTFGLHRLIGDWGEGSSSGGGQGAAASVGDATWRYTFFDTAEWNTQGGDYVAGSSATGDAGAVLGDFTLSSAGMAADVKAWADHTAPDFGWILVGGSEAKSARRFGSREHMTAANRPALTVQYVPGIPSTRRQDWLREYFQPGEYVDDLGNLDADPLQNLIEYALALDPKTKDSGAELPSIGFDAGTLVFSVRRDPRATDLTYQIEVSPDLEDWTVVTESIGGAVASGPGFFSETPIGGAEPLLLLKAKDQPEPGDRKRFIRLRVIRNP